MRIVGELCLLTAFVGSGFAAFVFTIPWQRRHRAMQVGAAAAALTAVLALTGAMAILAWALTTKDYRFAYVAQYSSRLLPWQYSLSALWVGQAGSLLLWAWLLGVLSLGLGWSSRQAAGLRAPAFGVLMGCLCFLSVILVFAADPMAGGDAVRQQGAGLSPLLQHPAMLIHPPVIFLGYALWTVPFALAVAALVRGTVGAEWIRHARPWALAAWAVLGVGILLGAQWAYEELGWGGYWAWDPVENGSLLPWLTGTALIHGMMAWQHRRILKRSTLVLAFATFGLCNFATFLTRSGLFSSLHAFSQSPIGWLFLGLMLAVGIGGAVLLARHWQALAADRAIGSVLSREAGVVMASLALSLLAATVLVGTLSSALSSILLGRAILVGPAFYNQVLIPTGLALLLSTAAVPLLRWGTGPSPAQRRGLLVSAFTGAAAAAAAWVGGIDEPVALAVGGLAVAAVAALAASIVIDARRQAPASAGQHALVSWPVFAVLRVQRAKYASFVVHLGFVCLALGVTGSSVGKQEKGFVFTEGQTVQWAGRQIRLARAVQRVLPDKLVGEVQLDVVSRDGTRIRLVPAQHFHRLQEQWTTELAIHSTWRGDFCAILHSGDLDGRLYVTLVENPLMFWMWAGGGIMFVGAAARLWPTRRRKSAHGHRECKATPGQRGEQAVSPACAAHPHLQISGFSKKRTPADKAASGR